MRPAGTTGVICLAVALTAASLAAAPVGLASPPPHGSGLWQYVEMVPTTSGPRPEQPSKKSAPVSKPVARAIGSSKTPESTVLRKVATSPLYGARVIHTKRRPAAPRTKREPPEPAAPPAATPAPNGSLLGGAGDVQLDVLLGLMAASLAAAVSARFVRART